MVFRLRVKVNTLNIWHSNQKLHSGGCLWWLKSQCLIHFYKKCVSLQILLPVFGNIYMSLLWLTALAHCSGPLLWPTALAHCSGPLLWPTAPAHCSSSLYYVLGYWPIGVRLFPSNPHFRQNPVEFLSLTKNQLEFLKSVEIWLLEMHFSVPTYHRQSGRPCLLYTSDAADE